MGIGIRVPKFGAGKPRAPHRPTSQEIMEKLKERNPNNVWRNSLYPAFVTQHAGGLTPITAILGTDPVLMGIGKMFGINEINNLQTTAREDPYGLAHEVTSKLAGGETYSDEWQAAKTAVKNEGLLAQQPARPLGYRNQSKISGLSPLARRNPNIGINTRSMLFPPETGLKTWLL